MRRTRAVGCVGVVVASGWGLAALAAGPPAPAPSATARALPAHFRLLLTETSDHGRLHVASYGPPRLSDEYDAPLAVDSFRGSGEPPYEEDPAAHPGDRATTVRGHEAVMRTLTDEEEVYAHELVWRERPDVAVAVRADLPLSKRTLRRVAEGVQIIDQQAWKRLYMQTSGAAQIGHVSRKMRRVRIEGGVLAGHRWRLLALIPPHFPLSRDDRRASCFELRYRRHRGHGDDCGLTANWQRIGGSVFVFGALYRPARHLIIRPYSGTAFRLRARTVSIGRGPHVHYFAAPLPADACAVVVARAQHPHEENVAAPIRGRDQRRCARKER
jgi:hypothetical protein